jgi:hypothetical protein
MVGSSAARPVIQLLDLLAHRRDKVHVEGIGEDREADHDVGEFATKRVAAVFGGLFRALVVERFLHWEASS